MGVRVNMDLWLVTLLNALVWGLLWALLALGLSLNLRDAARAQSRSRRVLYAWGTLKLGAHPNAELLGSDLSCSSDSWAYGRGARSALMGQARV